VPARQKSVASMTLSEKVAAAIYRAIELLPSAMAQEISSLFSKTALAAMIATAGLMVVALVASHAFPPAGIILDILTVLGFAATGATAMWGAWSLAKGIWCLKDAATEAELDVAARHFCDAMVLIGPELFFAFFTRGAGTAARAVKAAATVATKAGMTAKHLAAFQKVAKDMNRLLIVRNTNEKSIQWILKMFPGKARFIAHNVAKLIMLRPGSPRGIYAGNVVLEAT